MALPAKWKLPKIPPIVWRAGSFVLALFILVLFATQWDRWEGSARFQTTNDAYLAANLTPLSAQIAGYVQDVPVQDFAHVQAGQLIVLIDEAPYEAALAQARASVASAQAQLEQVQAQRPLLQANLRAADAVAAATSATLAQSGRDVARQQRLFSGGSSSQADLEKIKTVNAQLTAQLAQNHAQADAVARQIDLLVAQEDQARAGVAAAAAAERIAQINLSYTRITAPNDGQIATRQVLPGQFIAAGTQVTTLAGLPLVWVIANYKETQLTNVMVGNKATITVDTFPGRKLRGHVVAISPASGAQFALLPPDNATGNFTKIVQRVAVKIAIDDSDGLEDRLRPGLSVVPTIDTRSGPNQ